MDEITENPENWITLHWEKNHLTQYFGSKNIGHQNVQGDKKRKNFEILKPERQCYEAAQYIQSIDNHLKLELNVTPCYICGFTINQSGGDPKESPGGHQCEHILTASTIAMLTGLPSPVYDSEASKIIKSLQSKKKQPIYDDFYREYVTFQKMMWPKLYDWSHPACNEIKREFPFLKINFEPEGVVVVSPKETETNIKKLLGELLFSKHRSFIKKTIKQKTKKKTYIRVKAKKKISTPQKIQAWKEHILDRSKYKTRQSKIRLAINRYRSIAFKVQTIHKALESIDRKQLKLFSYLSTKTMLNVVISKTLSLGPIKWIQPLEDLFINSYNEIKSKIGQRGGGNVVDITSSALVYYTEDNVADDVIYSVLLMLSLSHPDLFNTMGVESIMIDMNMLSVDDIIHKRPSEQSERFSEFCIFFRNYLNSANAIKHIGLQEGESVEDEMIDYQFKENIINMIDYIWNIWSKLNSVEEAVIEGSGPLMDKLASGPQIDEYTNQFNETLYYIKILQEIGYEYIDHFVEKTKDESTMSEGGLAEGEPVEGEMDESSMSEMAEPSMSEMDMSESFKGDAPLDDMVFKIGGKEIYSNVMRG